MANSRCFRRIGFALVIVITCLPSAVRAKEFASNQYGFQISLPPGFREHPADVSNLIAEFIEPQTEGGGYPITISIRHTGPANYDLPRQKRWTSTLDKRRWKDIDLQVLRQEIAVSSKEAYVSYTVVFPLTDEGVIVVVQGLKSRESQVLKVFDNSIRQFVNLKPYDAVSGQSGEGIHSVIQVIFNVLMPVVTSAIVILWIVKVRKARSKP